VKFPKFLHFIYLKKLKDVKLKMTSSTLKVRLVFHPPMITFPNCKSKKTLKKKLLILIADENFATLLINNICVC